MKLELKLSSDSILDIEKFEVVLRADDLLFALKQVVKKVTAFESREKVVIGIEGILKDLEVWHLVS